MNSATSSVAHSPFNFDLKRELAHIGRHEAALKTQWFAAEPFRYVICDNFLTREFAEALLANYPSPAQTEWDQTTYTHQRKKFSKNKDFSAPFTDLFDLSASPEFRAMVERITGIEHVLDDPSLVGGGLHQIFNGGFLDVHVDYNFHPVTKKQRRLNLLVYLNKDWKREYQGRLELWDMRTKRQLQDIEPVFNRAVMFETNEISHHGHPVPLVIPDGVSRKSIAVYYYTDEVVTTSTEHNTLYSNTTGLRGTLKIVRSSVTASVERVRAQGVVSLVRSLARKARRRVQSLPPENQ
jgi:Rps23 Pro-64 3,4-dihydroxylase Tpa1-like proline 4-hydroxylase